jgi:hypothetical protein
MDDWFTRLPLSDNLDTESSGVFTKVHQKIISKRQYFWCQLCSPHEKTEEKLQESVVTVHLCDPLHTRRAKAALQQRSAALSRFEWALQFSRDVNYYSNPNLESMLCRYVFVGGNYSSKAAIVQKQTSLKLADPMVLLELALWKAACEQNPPEDRLSPLEWKEWSRSGWKRRKPSMRRDPLTCITVLVAPFLGLTKETASAKS